MEITLMSHLNMPDASRLHKCEMLDFLNQDKLNRFGG